MDYRRFDNTYVIRMERGEEIVEQVRRFAEREGVKLASVQALGAVDDFTVGVYNVAEKQYHARSFQGAYEIVSLVGTINTMNGEVYTHLHMSAGDEEGRVFGGHLSRGVISATVEMVVTLIPGTVDRQLDESIGINLFKF
ncbi:MAG: DNA-binding protein [Oscillospiraceae bacterium]|nr:DNA-binding protein [Oscillospiraceae bacterium]